MIKGSVKTVGALCKPCRHSGREDFSVYRQASSSSKEGRAQRMHRVQTVREVKRRPSKGRAKGLEVAHGTSCDLQKEKAWPDWCGGSY